MSEWTRLRKIFGALFALVIGFGYIAAVTNTYFTMHLADGDPAMTVNDIRIHFHGDPSKTLLATKLHGSMRPNLKDDTQLRTIMNWIAGGADRGGFEPVRQILQAQCVRCHNAGFFRPLETFEDVAKTATVDTGMTWERLARLSHEHLFGIGLLCFALGLLVAWTSIKFKYKVGIIALGFLSTLLDTGSWWLTRINPAYALLVMLSGALNGLFFGAGIFAVWYDAFLARGETEK